MGHKEIIEQHKDLANMIMEHGYAPKGSLPGVVAIESIYKEIGGKNVDKFCFSCVKSMFVHVYHRYYPTLVTNGNQRKGKAKEHK